MRSLVLWGHSLGDYQKMFGLSPEDLTANIVEVASGPTAFNAQMLAEGHQVISVDEMYGLPEADLKEHMTSTFNEHLEAIKEYSDIFAWGTYGSLEKLAAHRRKGMEIFLEDFPKGKVDGRYIAATPNKLPFPDFKFDIAVISHHLFAESDLNSIQDDIDVIKECTRIAKEIRVFPLVDNKAQLSPTVGPVMLALQQEELGVEIKEVPYKLQGKANAMMRVWALACSLR